MDDLEKGSEEKMTTPVKPARPPFALSEEGWKHLLVLLIAGVALFGTVVAALQVNSSVRAARASRDGRAYTLKAIGKSEAGILRYIYERNRLAAHQALVTEWALERRLAQERTSLTAAQEDERAAARLWRVMDDARSLSALLSPPYFDEETFYADVIQFGVNFLVVPPALTLEKEAAKREEADAWGAKSERYVVTITVLAVSLFLFGLAMTLRGRLKTLFTSVGVLIVTASLAFVLSAALAPVPRIPEESMTLYATGVGETYYAGILELGGAYGRVPDHADWAIESFTQAIALRPDYAAAYQARGDARLLKAEALLFGSGDSQKVSSGLAGSISDFVRAAALGRRDKETWSRLAWAYFLAERYPESVEAARRALALAPDLGLRLGLQLALALLGAEGQAKANEELEAALAGAEEHPLASDSLAFRAAIRGLADLERARPLPGMAKIERRLKEAFVSLTYRGTATVRPSGATVGGLTFESLELDAEGRVVGRRPTGSFAGGTDRVGLSFDYTGIPQGALVVLKVYWEGLEQTPLTQVERWSPPSSGRAERVVRAPIEHDFVGLMPGRYTAEVYVEGELLSSGTFEIE